MSNFFRYQLLRIWKAVLSVLLVLWGLLALFTYTAMAQYGPEICWFSVFRILQILLPIAAAVPLSFWMEPFLSADSAEILHSLPDIHRSVFTSTSLFLLVLWFFGNALPLSCLRLTSACFPLGSAMLRFFAQCLFSQAVFFLSAVWFRSALHGLETVFLLNGVMLLSLEIPALTGTILQKVNIFDLFTYTAVNPFSLGKELLITGISIALIAAGAFAFVHYYSPRSFSFRRKAEK